MGFSDPWQLIHGERKALAADLDGLTAEQWATPSMCDGWSVRDVLGHMVSTAKMTPPRFLKELASSGFQFHSMTGKHVGQETAGAPGDTLARFRTLLDAKTKPPGPVDTMVGECVVHGEDIRRPLGIKHEYPAEMLTGVADFYKGSNLIVGGKRRVAGLKLRATDTEWSSGEGPEVTGPLLSIVLAMVGRKPALADLSGEGVGTLQARM